MTNLIKAAALAAMSFATIAATVPMAAAEESTKIGTLECTVEGGVGLLIGSSKDAVCTFTHANGATENYTGNISKLGLDVGITGESHLKWLVFTPTGTELGEYALAGKYVGASASAALGVGLGANALVGGQAENIGLQPLSVEGSTGFNVAVGVSSLTLEPQS